jgi:hypothetical protein
MYWGKLLSGLVALNDRQLLIQVAAYTNVAASDRTPKCDMKFLWRVTTKQWRS